MAQKTVLFFVAGRSPTAGEQALIDRLALRYTVHVRATGPDATYGGKLEKADALAGTIPDTYKTGEGVTIDTDKYPDGDVTPAPTAKPEAIMIVPSGAVSFAHTDTLQLYAVSAELDEATEAVVLTERTAGTGIVWTSSNEAKATVANGLVTGVAAGTATITVTYTYATAKTVTATRNITLT